MSVIKFDQICSLILDKFANLNQPNLTDLKEYIYREDSSMEDVETRAKLVMGNVYILLGMSIVSMSLNLMWEKIVQNIRTAMRRIGLMRPARYD